MIHYFYIIYFKDMADYSKGIIYMIKKIDDEDYENVYIGSTINFIKRKNEHKGRCNNSNDPKHHYKIYKYIRENGGWDCFEIVELEKYPCNSKQELEKREDEIMIEYKNRLNTQRAHMSKEELKIKMEEYYQNNRDKILERGKEWRENNKEKKAEQDKKWRENNKEKVVENKRLYHINNRDKILERVREWSENNQDKIKEKVKCDNCGSEVTRRCLKNHKKTIKCQEHKK